MPGITNPAEEYFKNGLWAWDPAGGVWLKLIIDPLTNRLVIDHPGDLEVVQPTPADLCVGNYGWDGSAWHKLPMMWGYSDRWADGVTTTTGAAGTRDLAITHDGAGEVWVLEQVVCVDANTAPSAILLEVYDGTYSVPLVEGGVLVAGEWTMWHGRITLKEGDAVHAHFYTCALDDDVILQVWGHKMKIAE